jgi:putative aldouronate transport system substrate-binding protein
MAFPFTGNGKEATQVIWIRTDWRKKLGLEEPKTMQDVLKLAEAFSTKDPDGNNKDDTYGIAMDKDFSYHSFTGFLNSYHAYTDVWIKNAQGNIVYGDVQPEMRTALSELQKLYKNGELDKEFPVKDSAKVNEDLAAGKVGITFLDTSAAAGVLQKVKDNNPNAEWDAYPLLSIDSKPAKPQVKSTGPISYWVVKKGFKHPEAVLKMIDLFIQSYYLTTDEKVTQTYISSLDGVPNYLLTAASSYMPYNNLTTQTNVSSVLEGKKQIADLNPLDRAWYNRIVEFKAGNNAFWGINRVFGINGSRSIAIKYIKDNMLMENEFFVAATPVMTEKMATLEKMRDTTFINIITGSASIDAFDKFVEDWKKTGGNDITKEVNDWYKSL